MKTYIVLFTVFTRYGFILHKTTALLELFITEGRLLQLVWDQCQVSRSAEGQALMLEQSHWELLILTLVSLPSRMANRLRRENRYCSMYYYYYYY